MTTKENEKTITLLAPAAPSPFLPFARTVLCRYGYPWQTAVREILEDPACVRARVRSVSFPSFHAAFHVCACALCVCVCVCVCVFFQFLCVLVAVVVVLSVDFDFFLLCRGFHG
jgi:hypothetical protein